MSKIFELLQVIQNLMVTAESNKFGAMFTVAIALPIVMIIALLTWLHWWRLKHAMAAKPKQGEAKAVRVYRSVARISLGSLGNRFRKAPRQKTRMQEALPGKQVKRIFFN
ncbi:hypothetical protein V8J88_11400 [Massilia sp. W12]|uniref:hypothetical protein n=1 Tax=Massilia sp. W12 TaxID=3126507 RepID=UPI0030CAB3ED